MQIKDVMTREVEVVQPNTGVVEIARKMRNLNVGALPVCTGRRLLGMVTDRDITLRVIAGHLDPATTNAKDVMTPDAICCFEDQSVEEAAEKMAQYQVRRLPVISRDRDLVGIVSLGDLAVDSPDDYMTGRALEGISEPARPNR